jgi:hypothetical protein
MADARAVPTIDEFQSDVLRQRERGLWSDAFRRLIRNRLSVAALVLLISLIILVILGNYVDAIQR